MSTRHDPAAARDAEAARDDSAWLDTASAGASAWDDLSDGDASAWAGSAEPSASVWDDDAPAPASVWDDDAPVPATLWDDDASLPEGSGTDSPAGPDPAWDEASPTEPSQRGRPVRARAGRRASSVPGDGVPAEQSPEVAAVAARLAEIVGRPGAGRPAPAAPATSDEEPGPTGSDRSRGPGGASRRRATPGRRRAPATEPPESGAAGTDAEPDQESVARAIALRQLTAAPRSRAQLAEAMAKRDVPEDVADRVLDRFTEVGLVDDAAYAEILVRSRHAERGMSRRALAMELRRKGVDDDVAREALEQVDDADEEQAARALARKKLRASRGLDREVRLRRAYGALGRRGYGGSLVSRVVREELDAEGADGADAGDGWPGGLDSL